MAKATVEDKTIKVITLELDIDEASAIRSIIGNTGQGIVESLGLEEVWKALVKVAPGDSHLRYRICSMNF